jgi:MOSC domain-containing protein YiiM
MSPGETTEMGRAWIFQINASDGGVPKLALRNTGVTSRGLVGDRQRNLRHHGGPDRALCLYSLESILALQAEGHPVYPGSLGENLTITGLDWGLMCPGTRWRLARDLLIEIVSYTMPCSTIAASFVGGQFMRASQEKHPGWSRVYARVLSPGTIQIGDPVTREK